MPSYSKNLSLTLSKSYRSNIFVLFSIAIFSATLAARVFLRGLCPPSSNLLSLIDDSFYSLVSSFSDSDYSFSLSPKNESSPSSQNGIPESTIFSTLAMVLAEEANLFVKNSRSKMFEILLK
jgi:hypothetical protein